MKKVLAGFCFCAAFAVTGCATSQTSRSAQEYLKKPDSGQPDTLEGTAESKPALIMKFEGVYTLRVTGFEGSLRLWKENGVIKGTISFKNWGYGKEAPLKNLRIKGDRIYFIRSVITTEERIEFASPRFFIQEYYGQFKEGGSLIKGYFVEDGRENGWEARKMD